LVFYCEVRHKWGKESYVGECTRKEEDACKKDLKIKTHEEGI
jgi:hypothetical protein